ncbi:MAG: transposase [Candidatus Omnitrophica bacterium]|nr:transposase [Candidatus Omnitrophota bacterium]
MTRIPRTHVEGALVYVTSRGDNNENIFKDDSDYYTYLELLKKYKNQYGFKLFAFCFLPNHLHLLMELKEGLTTSEIMHDLNANYTKYFNGKHERKGHLFQERHKLVLVEKDAYIFPAMNYIHLNPLALGLTNDLKDYKYSSYLYYIGGNPQLEMEAEIREIKSRLSEYSLSDYAKYLAGIPKEQMESLGKELNKKTAIGSQDFIKKVEQLSAELETKPASQGSSEVVKDAVHGKFIRIAISGVVILGIFTLYLYANSMRLKKNFTRQLEQKESEIDKRLKEERNAIIRGVNEKQAADMVSYQAMAVRMEKEKQRAAELEEKLKSAKAGSVQNTPKKAQ